jgi:hypothetical protein
MAKYRKYSKDFKLQAAKLVTEQGYSYQQAAQRLGTTWLEEIIGLAQAGGDGLKIVKHIYAEAYKRFDELCEPYAAVIDIKRAELPQLQAISLWTSEKFAATVRHNQRCKDYDKNIRQLLHVGYKVAAEMGSEYLGLLEKYEGAIAQCVTENIFDRHIRPLFF